MWQKKSSKCYSFLGVDLSKNRNDASYFFVNDIGADVQVQLITAVYKMLFEIDIKTLDTVHDGILTIKR